MVFVSGLRPLLLHDSNQELLDHLGTRYEVVYPHQVRKDWARGLATTLEADAQGTVRPRLFSSSELLLCRKFPLNQMFNLVWSATINHSATQGLMRQVPTALIWPLFDHLAIVRHFPLNVHLTK